MSITILAIILLSTTNIINLLNKENQKTSTILIAKLDFETTRLYLEEKILIDANLANLTCLNDTLYYNNAPLLHNIDGFANDMKMLQKTRGCGKGGQMPLPVSFGAPHLRIRDVIIGGK